MISNKHLSVDSLYLYADHEFLMRIGRMKYKIQIQVSNISLNMLLF